MLAPNPQPETLAAPPTETLLNRVENDTRVLLVGHADEAMVRELAGKRCQIFAFVDAPLSPEAQGMCDRVMVVPPGRNPMEGEPEPSPFDVILLADAFTYHPEPQALLQTLKGYLRPYGFIVASFLNAAHVPVRLALLNGQTPLNGITSPERPPQFHTLETIEELFTECSLSMEVIGKEGRPEHEVTLPDGPTAVPAAIQQNIVRALSEDPEAWTYRFVVRAEPKADAASLGAIQHHFQALAEENAALTREILDLKATLRGLTKPIEELASKVEFVSGHMNEIKDAYTGQTGRMDRQDQAMEQFVSTLHSSLSPLSSYRPMLKALQDGEISTKEVQYQRTIHRIRGIVTAATPEGSRIVVISRGDDALLRFEGREGWHFPQIEDGVYAGHYPANSGDVIAHMEVLRERGGNFMLIPATSFWWLDYYQEFREHLAHNYPLVANLEDTCILFEIG